MKFLIQKFVHNRKVWYTAYYLNSCSEWAAIDSYESKRHARAACKKFERNFHERNSHKWEETFELPSSKNNFIEDWFLIEALLILIPFVFGWFVGSVY